jgi:hypothetical protein
MKKYAIKLVYDTDAESPREWDNLGTITAEHRRYDFSDTDSIPIERFEDIVSKKTSDYLYLPVYMYDHSGVSLSTSPFSCPWDSGQVGYIYVSKDNIRKEYGVKRISPKLKLSVYELLRQEISIYSQYINGEVYGFQIAEIGNEYIQDNYPVMSKCWEKQYNKLSMKEKSKFIVDNFFKDTVCLEGFPSQKIVDGCYGYYDKGDAIHDAIDNFNSIFLNEG